MTHQTTSLADKAATRITSLFVGFALLSMASFSSFAGKTPKMSELLDNNGFQTLLFALEASGLTSVLDSNKVTLFGPTDDVFDETAAPSGLLEQMLRETVGRFNPANLPFVNPLAGAWLSVIRRSLL